MAIDIKNCIHKRILAKIGLGSPHELVVKEVSPSGEWVRVQARQECSHWVRNDEYTVLEVLPMTDDEKFADCHKAFRSLADVFVKYGEEYMAEAFKDEERKRDEARMAEARRKANGG